MGNSNGAGDAWSMGIEALLNSTDNYYINKFDRTKIFLEAKNKLIENFPSLFGREFNWSEEDYFLLLRIIEILNDTLKKTDTF
jgi:hypothetical protein